MKVNKDGTDWQLIRKWAEERLESDRSSLEDYQPNDFVHYHRGRISVLRDLIRFVEPDKAPEQSAEPEDYGMSKDENYG